MYKRNFVILLITFWGGGAIVSALATLRVVNLKLGSNSRISKSSLAGSSSPAEDGSHQCSGYDLGTGKNEPFKNLNPTKSPKSQEGGNEASDNVAHWTSPKPVVKPPGKETQNIITDVTKVNSEENKPTAPTTSRRMVAHDQESSLLRAAMWDESHFDKDDQEEEDIPSTVERDGATSDGRRVPTAFYPDIDLSISETVYKEGEVDLVWDLMRWEAYQEAQREPLLVSFLYSTILNHPSLESSLSFMLANRLQSPAMMVSTQLQSIILNALETSPTFRRALRADIMAARDRDPAVNSLPDVFLYFKGFHALQSHRVANSLWTQQNKRVLARYLQSQVSQTFQIDIHPNATFGSGIMLDHGTGIVIGETASVGHNCSILHHVTLGGSGKKGVDRHPRVGDGVLLGAGATIIGPVSIGTGSQIGAGTLVITNIRPHAVAVGVPAKIIGSFIDVTTQPSIDMDQVMKTKRIAEKYESDGI